MATKTPKKKAAKASAPKFAGKTFLIAGKWTNWQREKATECLQSAGALPVEDLTEKLDLLLVAPSGTAQLRKKAEQLNKDGATIEILTVPELGARLLPTRE